MGIGDNQELEDRLIKTITRGIPLVSEPYKAIAKDLGCSEQQVIETISSLLNQGDIKRFGVIVRHRKLGYKSNAMVVWNFADEEVDKYGDIIAKYPFVTLCYQRPRKLPKWPYNLFSMIHGKDKNQVIKHIELIASECKVARTNYDALFSSECFKQRGANYDQTNNAS